MEEIFKTKRTNFYLYGNKFTKSIAQYDEEGIYLGTDEYIYKFIEFEGDEAVYKLQGMKHVPVGKD